MEDVIHYETLSDEEMQKERSVLAPGKYNFEVLKASKKTSSSGNDMVELVLKVWDNEGVTHSVYDHLVFTRKMAWKIKHFWESVGKPEKYDGAFRLADCMNASGLIETKLEKDKKGIERAKVSGYLPENSVKKTGADKPKSAPNGLQPTDKFDDFPDDDIPF